MVCSFGLLYTFSKTNFGLIPEVSRDFFVHSLHLQSLVNVNRELKQTDAAAANLQLSILKDSRPSEFSRPLTSITLNLNGDLPVDCPRVSLLKLPNIAF